MDNVAIVRNKLRLRNDLMRCLLSEFTSTALLLVKFSIIYINFFTNSAKKKKKKYRTLMECEFSITALTFY